jgi:chromosome partitioning protein
MNVLSIVSSKGGVGKTTAAQNIGAAIATFTGRKVLLIDLDPPAGLTKSLGIFLQPGQPTVADFILRKSTLAQTAFEYTNKSPDYKGKKIHLHIIPSAMSLVKDQEEIKQHKHFPSNLTRALEEENEKTPYDFVVIDCPASISILTDIALAASQRYYIPLQADFLGYEGLREFMSYADKMTLKNTRLQLGGIFASRFNPYTKKLFSKKVVDSVEKQFGDKLLKTYIRDNIALSKAQANGRHIFDFDDATNGASDYYDLTREIIFVRKS